MKKKPVTGMKDVLPEEGVIRNYVTALAGETYSRYGFMSIETPCVEHIENLTSKQGGENEKLIFKILKRGGKLDLSEVKEEQDLVEEGLRYDLTLPLSRYYSNNAQNLPSPFKAFQMGSVFRAERPQKGRFRQFTQCDIDILGDPTYLAEVELITATTTLLGRLDFKGFKVRINDRRILSALAEYAGVSEEKRGLLFIILDKLDKIGPDALKEELLSSDFDASGVDKIMEIFGGGFLSDDPLHKLQDILKDHLAEGCIENLETIMKLVAQVKNADFEVVFDPVLVRGMGYYTGTIFEIEMPQFGSSVAGGGRYDEMIGRFTGTPTPAVGFSIGFERIITILLEEHFKVPEKGVSTAILLEKGLDGEKMAAAMKEAADLRAAGSRVLLVWANKNKKFQKEQLTKAGYDEFREYYREELKH
ncbi:MAG: histidine--tRNA ligase [Lachnospiraceae bacterium]|nr:histidine--tRNA ligase [Lachnospiraceae bacterium]MBR0147884.1 histidine--tRNA ligase [Lachnospiraceae bacterium]MBR4174593.1 histidine--tRNA ligase [Lachnospiraceae bacterium]